MDDQVRQPRLLQRRLESLDELVRELVDEADRVGDEVGAAVVLVAARGRVERVEEPRPDPHPRAGHRVQQGRLTGVGVTGERHLGSVGGLAAGAHDAAVLLDPCQAASQGRDSIAGQAPVGLDLGLARTPSADAAIHAACTEPFQVGPEAAHAREVVLQLRELDLELALGRMGVVGEDVEDDRGPVDHRHVERGLEVSLLSRSELVIAGDEVGAAALDLGLELVELAATEIAVGIGRRAYLHRLAGRGDSGGPQQLLELGERIAVAGRPRDHADRQRSLYGPSVVHAGGSFHRLQSRSEAPLPGKSTLALRPEPPITRRGRTASRQPASPRRESSG